MDTTPSFPSTPQAPATPVGQGFAITGLVLGIVGVFMFWLYAIVPILAIIFSGIAMNKAKQVGAKPHGMAIAGLVLGIIFTIPGALIAVAVIDSL